MATETTALVRLDPQALLSAAIERGAGIETMERLVALAKDMRAELARAAFFEALSAFQADCPPIKKSSRADISTRSGGKIRYTYASLDEIMSTINPCLAKHGLAASWRQPRAIATEAITVCRITHRLGHFEESGEVSIPVERAVEGGSGANQAQRMGIALTYSRRYSLCGVLGLAPEDDTDAHGTEHERPTKPERQRVVDQSTGEVLGQESAPHADGTPGTTNALSDVLDLENHLNPKPSERKTWRQTYLEGQPPEQATADQLAAYIGFLKTRAA